MSYTSDVEEDGVWTNDHVGFALTGAPGIAITPDGHVIVVWNDRGDFKLVEFPIPGNLDRDCDGILW